MCSGGMISGSLRGRSLDGCFEFIEIMPRRSTRACEGLVARINRGKSKGPAREAGRLAGPLATLGGLLDKWGTPRAAEATLHVGHC